MTSSYEYHNDILSTIKTFLRNLPTHTFRVASQILFLASSVHWLSSVQPMKKEQIFKKDYLN